MILMVEFAIELGVGDRWIADVSCRAPITDGVFDLSAIEVLTESGGVKEWTGLGLDATSLAVRVEAERVIYAMAGRTERREAVA